MHLKKIVQEVAADAGSPCLVPAIATGMVNGTLLVIITVSFGAMIFSGDLSPLAPRAAGLVMFGAFAMGLVVLFASEVKTNIPIPQDAPTATLTSAVPAAAALVSVSQDAAFMTMAGIMMLSSLTTGLAFWCIGRYRLANLFKFIPYPVIGGFLAGSGWLLVTGGIGVMSGFSPGFHNLDHFFALDILVKWGPGMVYAGILFWAMQNYSHHLLLPGALVGGGLLYYLGFALLGISIDHARQLGFLISGLPQGGLWPAFGLGDLAHVHWDVVLAHIPLALTVALVTIISMLLNMSGIEVSRDDKVDMNREFSALGYGNLLSCLGGSSPGCSALALSVLGMRTRAVTRIGGIVSTGVVGAALFMGSDMLTFFPKPLLGALLVVLGLFSLWEWVVIPFRKMPWMEYGLILGITGVIAWQGFLEGVAFGIAVTVIIFVVRFSRVSAIRSRSDLAACSSLRHRSAPERHILKDEGPRCLVYQLSGYIFFGSASSLVDQVQSEAGGGTRLVLMDFSRVMGMDISAIHHFKQLISQCHRAGCQVVLARCPKSLRGALGDSAQDQGTVFFAGDLDKGLEFCEDRLIQQVLKSMAGDTGKTREALFHRSVDDVMARLERLERLESLAAQLSPWAIEDEHVPGSFIVRAGDAFPGMVLILAGAATELEADGTRIGTLDAGSVVGPGAQFCCGRACTDLAACGQVRTLTLTPEARAGLEKESPALAMALDRYVLEQFGCQT